MIRPSSLRRRAGLDTSVSALQGSLSSADLGPAANLELHAYVALHADRFSFSLSVFEASPPNGHTDIIPTLLEGVAERGAACGGELWRAEVDKTARGAR
jgi:hypothetical protein